MCRSRRKSAGACSSCKVAEGDRVNQGDLIARLDTRDTELALARARADRAQADAQLRLLLAGSRPEDIRQAQAQATASRADVAAAAADLSNAQADLERYEALLRANAGSRKARDDAQMRRDVAEQKVRGGEGACPRERGIRGARQGGLASAGDPGGARPAGRRGRADRDQREGARRRHDRRAGRRRGHREAGQRRRARCAANAARRDHRPGPCLGRGLRGRADCAARRSSDSRRRCSPMPARAFPAS